MGTDKRIKLEMYVRNIFKKINNIDELENEVEKLYVDFEKSEESQNIITDIYLQRKEKLLGLEKPNNKWLTENAYRKKIKEEMNIISSEELCRKILNSEYEQRKYTRKKI